MTAADRTEAMTTIVRLEREGEAEGVLLSKGDFEVVLGDGSGRGDMVAKWSSMGN